MLVITDFSEKLGISRHDADNWRKRVGLLTEYKPTVAGRAQEYSRDNVLELAGTAAFVRSGMPPKSAIALANALIRSSKVGDVRDWVVFPAGDFSTGVATNDPTTETLKDMAAKSTTGAVVAIPQRQIVDRVDALFRELGEV
ncbi:hypothetical protein [Paracoccus sp. S3-43]|uniref:hypothetical protein n=1 Tax=Paracoccus sp. S3-43 TaxID=3030011 RepID=UPI0023B05C46|nr:hypothetical protein [Paracoccus sp. S3-43]WEF24635.1 hypothetical protein PXD02_01290 [Paracoccus sp. S3-43]